MISILHFIDDICILSYMPCWRYVFYDKILQDKKGAVDQAPFSTYLMFGKRFSLNYLLLETTRSMNGRGFPLVVLKE